MLSSGLSSPTGASLSARDAAPVADRVTASDSDALLPGPATAGATGRIGGGVAGRAGAAGATTAAAGAAVAREDPPTRSRNCRTPIPSLPSQLSPFLLFPDRLSDAGVADLDAERDADMA
jgi:hypothetical protein